MFEIGSSLRGARMRQGLELSEVERETRIRAKYLGALEDERFDVLPGDAYAKGFLRTYADYLGLDAQRFVDEYKTRFAPEEEPAAPAPIRIRRHQDSTPPVRVCTVAARPGSAGGEQRRSRLAALEQRQPPRHACGPACADARDHPGGTACCAARGHAPGDGHSDRARRHARPLLALRPPGLGDRQSDLRRDARAGSNRALQLDATLDPHRRPLEHRRNLERTIGSATGLNRRCRRNPGRPQRNYRLTSSRSPARVRAVTEDHEVSAASPFGLHHSATMRESAGWRRRWLECAPDRGLCRTSTKQRQPGGVARDSFHSFPTGAYAPLALASGH